MLLHSCFLGEKLNKIPKTKSECFSKPKESKKKKQKPKTCSKETDDSWYKIFLNTKRLLILHLHSTEETKLAFRKVSWLQPTKKGIFWISDNYLSSLMMASVTAGDSISRCGTCANICFHFYLLELCSSSVIISWQRYSPLGNATLLFVMCPPAALIWNRPTAVLNGFVVRLNRLFCKN